MSLLDTIKGAREEAEGNLAPLPKKDTEADKTEETKKGSTKRSAASAKPVREAAASVRVSSSSSSSSYVSPTETKEQKKERRRRERETEDLRTRAIDVITKANPEYVEQNRKFWMLLGTGLVCAVISIIFTNLVEGGSDVTTDAGAAAVAVLIAAYGMIIWAFVLDWRKRRPIRRAAEDRVHGMTDKKVAELLAIDREQRRLEEAQAEAEKAARKAARKK